MAAAAVLTPQTEDSGGPHRAVAAVVAAVTSGAQLQHWPFQPVRNPPPPRAPFSSSFSFFSSSRRHHRRRLQSKHCTECRRHHRRHRFYSGRRPHSRLPLPPPLVSTCAHRRRPRRELTPAYRLRRLLLLLPPLVLGSGEALPPTAALPVVPHIAVQILSMPPADGVQRSVGAQETSSSRVAAAKSPAAAPHQQRRRHEQLQQQRLRRLLRGYADVAARAAGVQPQAPVAASRARTRGRRWAGRQW